METFNDLYSVHRWGRGEEDSPLPAAVGDPADNDIEHDPFADLPEPSPAELPLEPEDRDSDSSEELPEDELPQIAAERATQNLPL